MNHEKNDEFEERAAIREFEGGQPRGTAEFFAREELAAKRAQDGCIARHRDLVRMRNSNAGQEKRRSETKSARSDMPSQQLQQLQDQRDEVGSRMRAETDEQEKEKLLDKWMDLNWKIIELRKAK